MSSLVAYRLGDGAPVTIEAARAIWAAVARKALEEASTATSATHSELARQVQQRSGVYTRMPASQWLPAVLADLGDAELLARSRADPAPPAARAKTPTVRKPRAAPAAPKRQ